MHKNNKTNIDDNFIALPKRANADKEINEQGRKIIDLCKTYNLAIMNGRSEGDPLGTFTYQKENLCNSTIDYSICNKHFYHNINNFMVLPQNELSDHCKIVTELKEKIPQLETNIEEYQWTNIERKAKYKWDESKEENFKEHLCNSHELIADIYTMYMYTTSRIS